MNNAPVDFITAYMDCKENGFMYTRECESYTVKAFMGMYDGEVEIYFEGESVEIFFPEKTLWIKVV